MPSTTLAFDDEDRPCSRCGSTKKQHDEATDGIPYIKGLAIPVHEYKELGLTKMNMSRKLKWCNKYV